MQTVTDLQRVIQATIRPQRRNVSMTKPALEVAAFSGVGPLASRAVAYAGAGLDLVGGEYPLAAIATYDDQRGFEHRLGVVITTTRTIMGGWSSIKGQLNDVRNVVGHDEIVRVDAKAGMLAQHCDVITTRGPQKFVVPFAYFPEIEGFFRGVLALSPADRRDAGAPLAQPSAADPTAAESAIAGLWCDDTRAAELLRAIAGYAAAGRLAVEHAIDFVGRVTLAHRAAAMGPAAYGTAFLSPLSADDLGNLLVGALGTPLGYATVAQGTHALEFRYDPQRDQLSPALAALGIASFVGLGIGFSPGRMIAAEMMRKPRLDVIRIVYADVAGGCAYEIFGNGRRLELTEGELAHALHQLVIHSALGVLERRVHMGWQVPYAELFSAA